MNVRRNETGEMNTLETWSHLSCFPSFFFFLQFDFRIFAVKVREIVYYTTNTAMAVFCSVQSDCSTANGQPIELILWYQLYESRDINSFFRTFGSFGQANRILETMNERLINSLEHTD